FGRANVPRTGASRRSTSAGTRKRRRSGNRNAPPRPRPTTKPVPLIGRSSPNASRIEQPEPPMNRRDFLAALPAVPALASAADPPRMKRPADPPRDLPPTGADLGTLFPDVEKLAAANRYAFTFPGGSLKSYEEYRAAARAKVLELLVYRPEPVDLRPDV